MNHDFIKFVVRKFTRPKSFLNILTYKDENNQLQTKPYTKSTYK